MGCHRWVRVVFFVFSFLWMFLMEGMGWALRQEQTLHTGVIGLEHVAMRWMNGDEEVILRGAIFDERRFVFKVVDNPPDSSKSLADRALEVGALAGVNGGFFSKEFEPLGGICSRWECDSASASKSIAYGCGGDAWREFIY